ncbi:MAG TPA: deoxyribodipyrimidine photo-lyase [Candidatus Acidoferrales bacterium]|nr:deoxyribodipyrimidine photo-lyase [Candidatus Acidoferrales bacterium]HTX56540.1 deoxyribodipyrimidine photo-lyase [Candidatus Acidoferrales bacterium]
MAASFIYRFMHDLRVDDHAGLAEAASQGEVLPVLVIDRAIESRLARSPRRAAYFCAAVGALDKALRERGARLIVRRGAPGATLKNIARACAAHGVAWSVSYDGTGAAGDARLQSELEETGLRALLVHDAPAIPPDETAAARPSGGDGYRAFAPYYDVWRSLRPASHDAPLLIRFAASELQSEALPVPHEFGAGERAIEAGPQAAVAALKRFLGGAGVQYALAMNVPSDDCTSHLAAHLSFGAIAARTVVRATLARLEDPFLLSEERLSLRLFLRSIAMRDFFLQLGHFYGPIDDEALQPKMRGFPFARSHPALDKWRGGKTGFPLVDAGIRQLHETGWMHPHVRAVVASFLCFDLGVDWRIGRDEWERWLVEDDPVLASGNWQWIAGVGADMAQYPRIYNPEKQRRRYDPGGAYVRRWVSELAQLPMSAWETRGRDEAQLTLALFASDVYPRPVVNHELEARRFLEKYKDYTSRVST